jgi:hypothetical protein
MSKKRKKKRSGRVQERTRQKAKTGKKNVYIWVGGAIALVVLVVALWGRLPFTGTEGKKGQSFSVQGGETRPVLDPFLFSGRARLAYAAAEKYPEVMDQVFCYCGCDASPFYHKSLLSCYVDKHGAG